MTVIDNAVAATDKYTIEPDVFTGEFLVLKNGEYLRDSADFVRRFATRGAARKRISRERRGSFHN